MRITINKTYDLLNRLEYEETLKYLKDERDNTLDKLNYLEMSIAIIEKEFNDRIEKESSGGYGLNGSEY